MMPISRVDVLYMNKFSLNVSTGLSVPEKPMNIMKRSIIFFELLCGSRDVITVDDSHAAIRVTHQNYT